MITAFKEHSHSNEYFTKLRRDHLVQSVQSLNFIHQQDQESLQQQLISKKVHLPQKDYYHNKKTLIFDLDETLIHCNETGSHSDIILPIRFPTGDTIEAGINIRPYAKEILKELSFYYEIIVFTASHSCYANVVLDMLDPGHQYIQHRLFRDSCIQTQQGVYVKDLRIFANRHLANILLVDNAAYSYGFQVSNGIPCIPYYDNKKDTELKKLSVLLRQIHKKDKIQPILSNLFKIGKYLNYQSPGELIDKLFKYE